MTEKEIFELFDLYGTDMGDYYEIQVGRIERLVKEIEFQSAPRELSDEEIKKCVIAWVKQIYGNEYVTPSDSHIINGTKLIRLAEKRIFKNDSL